MSKKLLSSILFLSLFLLLLGGTTGWAEDPSSLIVVRGSDGSLWKETCLGSTCSGFTSFPGNFSSQPTVFWDEVLNRFVLWGRAYDNSIWRSTFSAAGLFDNNWAVVAGATPSPIGAAGAVRFRPIFDSTYGSQAGVSTLSVCENYTNLAGFSLNIPRAGWIIARATGIYSPGVADKYIRTCIGDTVGGACDSWDPFLESTAYMFGGYAQEKIYALQKWYAVTAGSKTVYLKACRQDTATTGNVLWDDFIMTFQSGN